MEKKKACWGIYCIDRAKNEEVPIYFMLTPCIGFCHYQDTIQGGFYLGWLQWMLFIPYLSATTRPYQFYFLPFIGWRKWCNTQTLSFSWLFWSWDFLTLGEN